MRPNGRRTALACAVLLVSTTARADECGPTATTDIRVIGSPWYGFTQMRVQQYGLRQRTMTITRLGGQDVSLELAADQGTSPWGRIVGLAGRAELMRGVDNGINDEYGPHTVTHLIPALLHEAFPQGPQSVGPIHPVHIRSDKRALRTAVQNRAERFEAPWTLSGTVRSHNGGINYDLEFTFQRYRVTQGFSWIGSWSQQSVTTSLDDRMLLDGWTLRWTGPVTMEPGSTFDFNTPISQYWPDLRALRLWLTQEPERRLRGRRSVDPTNPGLPATLAYEAFAIDRCGARTRLGQGVRTYRPGVDITAEEGPAGMTIRMLTLNHGLSIVMSGGASGFSLRLTKDDVHTLVPFVYFSRENGPVFRGITGTGRVNVNLAERDGRQAMTSLEFLEDLTLEHVSESTGITSEVRILKGSILRLRP